MVAEAYGKVTEPGSKPYHLEGDLQPESPGCPQLGNKHYYSAGVDGRKSADQDSVTSLLSWG